MHPVNGPVYEKLCALRDKMRDEFNATAARMMDDLTAAASAHDPPGFLPRRQARARAEYLIAVCANLLDEFVVGAEQSCGFVVGERARMECDDLLVKLRVLTNKLLAKYDGDDDV
jgi:hypothetical protein